MWTSKWCCYMSSVLYYSWLYHPNLSDISNEDSPCERRQTSLCVFSIWSKLQHCREGFWELQFWRCRSLPWETRLWCSIVSVQDYQMLSLFCIEPTCLFFHQRRLLIQDMWTSQQFLKLYHQCIQKDLWAMYCLVLVATELFFFTLIFCPNAFNVSGNLSRILQMSSRLCAKIYLEKITYQLQIEFRFCFETLLVV